MQQTIELLAPARDFVTGRAAIDVGADAVYIGAPRFGAREAAGNSLKDIERLCQYAHRYWARVYVTFNTLLYDDEFPAALQLIDGVYQAGADGLIIQDAGLLECELPPLPLVASTQMHNNTPEKVAFLEQVGFQRAILARELSLTQIQQIRARTTLELEFFVHGALCVSYSGQCYLSYALGGRSGNRGQCAQTCRRRYRLEDAHGRILAGPGHLLSLRDLNLSDYLADLIEAGISTFKIEGRLKDKTYVMNIVGYYRQKLDALLPQFNRRKRSSGRVELDFNPDPNKTFNRGYTRYFLVGGDKNLAASETPKHLGEPIGRVTDVDKDYFLIDSQMLLTAGDGICYFDAHHGLSGTRVNRVQANRIFPDKMPDVAPGSILYRNKDHAFLKKLDKSSVRRKIAVDLQLAESDQGLVLSANDEDGNSASQALAYNKISANKPKQALVTIQRQLERCGDTDFHCREITLKLKQIYFIPVSLLNQLRRATLIELVKVRLNNRPMLRGGVKVNSIPYFQQELTYQGNVLNQKAQAFYRRHGVVRIEPAAESGRSLLGDRVMTTKFCLKNQLGHCQSRHTNEPWFLVDDDGNRFSLKFQCDACEMELYYHSTKPKFKKAGYAKINR